MKSQFLALALTALCATGCQTYRYRVVQPSSGAPSVTDQTVTIRYEPLEYRLSQDRQRLAMLITNPTTNGIVLLGSRSFAVDPRGESRPLRDRVIGPNSFTRMLIPPVPFKVAYPDYWTYGPGWGWGWGWGGPWWGSWYVPAYWGPPPVSYHQIVTTYDWKWKEGPARLHLVYDRAGKTFEHDFEFVRERAKD